jgi:serine/threonine-protein kinase RsbW
MLTDMNQLIFSCNLNSLKIVREFVRARLSSHLIDKVTLNQIVLAVDEISANLIIHSNNKNPNQNIILSLDVLKTPKGISIELRENGIPFDYLQYNEPSIPELLEKGANGKLGLILVRRIMDKIEYLHFENQNICRLYKSLA